MLIQKPKAVPLREIVWQIVSVSCLWWLKIYEVDYKAGEANIINL